MKPRAFDQTSLVRSQQKSIYFLRLFCRSKHSKQNAVFKKERYICDLYKFCRTYTVKNSNIWLQYIVLIQKLFWEMFVQLVWKFLWRALKAGSICLQHWYQMWDELGFDRKYSLLIIKFRSVREMHIMSSVSRLQLYAQKWNSKKSDYLQKILLRLFPTNFLFAILSQKLIIFLTFEYKVTINTKR